MRKLVAAIACRNNGSRLYGKPIQNLDITSGVTVLDHLIELMKTIPEIKDIVLGISEGADNTVFKDYAQKHNIKYIFGDEKDVLLRLIQCGEEADATDIFRITSESPFTYFELISPAWKEHVEGDYDATFVDHVPDGSNFEIIGLKALKTSHQDGEDKHRSELCTLYIRENPDQFSIKRIDVPTSFDRKDIRLTVDYPEDLILCRSVYEHFKELAPKIPLTEIITFLDSHPELLELISPLCPDGYKTMYLMKEKETEGKKTGINNQINKEMKEKKMVLDNTNKLLVKAKELIPCAAQTYSKSYRYFVEGAAPAFLEKGEGGYVWDVDGNKYIDFICALGPVTLGYNNKDVNKAVEEQLKKGISFSQPTKLEVDLAEKLTQIVPCAEMVRFVKNGSDATTAAVRLARAYIKKDIVLCSGYHGFHDWYIASTNLDLGIPPVMKTLIKTFEYNNLESLRKAFEENKGDVAAVIMEPMQDNGPNEGYLEEVKRITHENGAVLIYDEVISGFRMALGGAQEYFKVIPDLAAIGKGMGNGLSISAVVGKKEIVRLIEDGAFISSTFGGETLAIAGALETIKQLEKPGTFEHFWNLGNRWKEEVQKLLNEKEMNKSVRVVGVAPHCGVLFTETGNLSNHDLFSVFQQTLAEEGILSLGINNFCLAHTIQDVDYFIQAVDKSLDVVLSAIRKDSVEGILKGGKFRPVFKRN